MKRVNVFDILSTMFRVCFSILSSSIGTKLTYKCPPPRPPPPPAHPGYLQTIPTAPIAPLVERLLQGMGGHGFDPGPRHTKVVKNGTSWSSLGTQTYWVELGLVDLVSGLCDWVWYHVKCLGHDTSVRQHYKK